jgi:hypothetical protein
MTTPQNLEGVRTMSKPAWGGVARRCIRCGKVGPRCMVAGGWVHARCRTSEEKREARKLLERLSSDTRND